MKLRKLFASNLQHFRQLSGMNQRALSDASGVSTATVSDGTNAKKAVTLDTVEQLAAALRVEPWMLLATPEDRELVELYRTCPPVSRALVLQVLRGQSRLASS